MKTILFTADEPLYLPQYLSPVFETHSDSIAKVILAPPATGRLHQIREYYRMFGPVDFLRFGIRFARGKLFAALSRKLGFKLTERNHSVAVLANEHDVPVRRVTDVTEPSFIADIEDQNPDLLLSVACEQKLGTALLDIPEWAINVHGSLLPKYRGRIPAFWPLYYGDEESGVTAHVMSEKIDAGPIIRQQSFDINPDDTMHEVYLKIAETGSELIIGLLSDLKDGEIETRPNRTTPEDYHTIPTPQERREFKHQGDEFL